MKYDQYGQAHIATEDATDLLYQRPDLDLSNIKFDNPDQFNAAVKVLYSDIEELQQYQQFDFDLEQFDQRNQSVWRMPEEYVKLDIARWVLNQCETDPELQRVADELMLFQERNLFDLLRWLKYFVDTMRANQVVWGVGRGSSVASYVLYLIGVHKINSMYYDLDISEFLK
jgi:DNA polymerase III alpha subunit